MMILKINSSVWLSLCVLFCAVQAIKTAKDRRYVVFAAVAFTLCLLYVVLS
jgi:hypothetical protein